MTRPWLYIILAGMIETIWPFVMKRLSTHTGWSPLIILAVFGSPIMFLLNEAVKQLSPQIVYATFAGIATAGTAIVGVVFLQSSASPARMFSFLMLLAGLVGLRLTETY